MDGEDSFYFMEMNTRLQVEHRVSELITGVDLVAWQIRIAQGEKLPLKQTEIHAHGHAIQVRLYAEDPLNNYLPSTGLLEQVSLVPVAHALVDSGVRTSDSVTIHYDPMIAKLVVWADDRATCIQNMQQMLNQSAIFGVQTNMAFLSTLLNTHAFKKHQIYTNTLDNNELDLSHELKPEVIAIYVDHLLRSDQPNKAWHQATGWRMQGANPLELQLEFNGVEQSHTIAWEDGAYLVDSQHHYLPQSQDVCHVHRNEVQIVHENLRYGFSLPNHESQASASNANVIYAPMPGKIIEVKAQAGDSVKIGQTLVVMEAMKMELELKVERDGVIAAIPYQAGDQVKAETELVELVAQ